MKGADDQFLDQRQDDQENGEERRLFQDIDEGEGAFSLRAELERFEQHDEFGRNQRFHERKPVGRERDADAEQDGRLVDDQGSEIDIEIGRNNNIFDQFTPCALGERRLRGLSRVVGAGDSAAKA